MNGFRMVTGIALLANASALAESYVWDGADGSSTLGPVTVEKASGVASLTGSNSSWAYAGESSYASLVGIDLLSATTLSSLTVADGVDFKAAAGALDSGAGAWPATIIVNHARATFVASVENPIVSAATISGAAGVVAFTGDGSGGIEMEEATYAVEGAIANDWSIIIRNTRLSDLTAVSGMFRATYAGKGYFFENDGNAASVQIQYRSGSSMLGVIIDFKQEGADIRLRRRVSTAIYSTTSNPGYEEPGSFKFIITENGGAGSKIYPVSSTGAEWSTYWYATDLTLEFKSMPGSYTLSPKVELTTASALTGDSHARVEFGDAQGSPIEATVSNKGAFTGAEAVVIYPNAEVTLTAEGNSSSGYGLTGSDAWYVLKPGARLKSMRAFSIGGWQGVELGAGAEWQQLGSSTYLSKLKYNGGAKTMGDLNIGQGYNPSIKVDGQGDSSVHEGAIRVYTYTR